MAVLVTGATGFVGGRLAQILGEQGEEIRILVRDATKLGRLENYNVRIFVGDITDPESLIHPTKNCTHIYHCAGASTDWATWDNFYQTNVLGVQNLLNVALNVPTLERFLHVSTTDVYGYPRIACDETHDLVDVGLPYNRTKIMGEQAVWKFNAEFDLPTTIIRPVSIYGPRGKDFTLEIGNLLVAGSMVVANGGHTHAGLVYIDNVVHHMISAANSPNTIGKAYNVRDDVSISWREYVSVFADMLNKRHPWLNIPSKIAFPMATIIEAIYKGLHISSRPLLTQHAVYIMCRDQGYAIDAAQKDWDFAASTRVDFAEGMEKSVAWFLSTINR